MGGSFGGSNLAGSKTTPLHHAKALSETLGGPCKFLSELGLCGLCRGGPFFAKNSQQKKL